MKCAIYIKMKVKVIREANPSLEVEAQEQEINADSELVQVDVAISLAKQLNRDNPELVHKVEIVP